MRVRVGVTVCRPHRLLGQVMHMVGHKVPRLFPLLHFPPCHRCSGCGSCVQGHLQVRVRVRVRAGAGVRAGVKVKVKAGARLRALIG